MLRLRLEVNGALIQSQVARSQDEVLTAQAEWRTAMIDEGMELKTVTSSRLAGWTI
jgi:hypothetical protein